jgi:hypothetical protein
MQRSEQIGQLIAALAKAQAVFKPVGKDKTARIASQKGSFSYAYADLATVVEATRPALAANGLAVVQPVRLGDDQIIVTTILAHSSGEWLSEEMSWPVASADNRSIGSGVTYARRHSYLAIVGGAATDEDDDAETARGGAHETAKPENRAAAIKAKIAEKTNGKPVPGDSIARKADLFLRMKEMGIPGAKMAEQLGEWLGHVVDKDTVFTADDWSRANAAIEQAEAASKTLAKARATAEAVFNAPGN